MKIDKKNDSIIFRFTYKGFALDFEFFNIEYIENILNDLAKMGDESAVDEVYRIELPVTHTFALFKEKHTKYNKDRYYFAYIKFFEFDGVKYGLVGGKTNYLYPDISFDTLGKNDKRFARIFLNEINKNWDREVLIVNHKPKSDRASDEQLSLFIECFLQRRFHLFNS